MAKNLKNPSRRVFNPDNRFRGVLYQITFGAVKAEP